MTTPVNSVMKQSLVAEGYSSSCQAPSDNNLCGFSSDIADWQYDTFECQPFPQKDQANCSKPNKFPDSPGFAGGTCPRLPFNATGTAAENVNWYSVSDQYNSLGQGRYVVCQYLNTDFKTTAQVTVWRNTFLFDNSIDPNIRAENQQVYDNIIMPYFCKQKADDADCIDFTLSPTGTTSCPNGLTGCSNFSSKGDAGTLCNDWLNKNRNLAFSTTQEFCNENVCAQDCLCYNRAAVDPIYDAVVSGGGKKPGPGNTPVIDACWYLPCKNTPPYLQPFDQQVSNSCPTFICDQIINVVDDSNININIASQTITCSIPPPSGPTGMPTPSQNIWQTYGVYIVIAGIIVLFLIIIPVIIYSGTRGT